MSPAPSPSAAGSAPAADLSTLDVARELDLAVRSVQLMVDRGELQAWKTPGGHRRISRASVQAWQARHRPHAPTAAEPGARGAAGTLAGERARVLLIEDSVHYQTLVTMLVKQRFPEVDLHVAGDGIVGLAKVGELRPHVLLVDILLPGIDGAALISTLRSHPQFSSSRLIVVTSLDEAERAPYAFALEGLPVVHKPRLVLDLPGHLQADLQALAAAT